MPEKSLGIASTNFSPQIFLCKNDHNSFVYNSNQLLFSTFILPDWRNNYPCCLLESPLCAHTLELVKVPSCPWSSICLLPRPLSAGPFRQQHSAVPTPLSGTGTFALMSCSPAETTDCKSVAWRLHLAYRCILFGLCYVLETFSQLLKVRRVHQQNWNFWLFWKNHKI